MGNTFSCHWHTSLLLTNAMAHISGLNKVKVPNVLMRLNLRNSNDLKEPMGCM